MSNWATWAIIAILCVGMLCMIALMSVSIAESVQEMRHQKEEWARERERREWGHK